jgi:hypothetical protein
MSTSTITNFKHDGKTTIYLYPTVIPYLVQCKPYIVLIQPKTNISLVIQPKYCHQEQTPVGPGIVVTMYMIQVDRRLNGSKHSNQPFFSVIVGIMVDLFRCQFHVCCDGTSNH